MARAARRVPRTYRLREDYVRAIDALALERRKEKTAILEEALELYLSPTVLIVAPNGSSQGRHRDADAPAESPAG